MNSITNLAVASLFPHPKNPRIEPRQEIVDQIASQITAKGIFDPSHALIVREVGGQYQIVSGHHRWLAAQQAELKEIPCWVKEMTDEQAYMELVLCNTQSELSALERGIHALHSGVSGSEYARSVGRTQQSVALEIQAAKVYEATTHVVTKVMPHGITDPTSVDWRNLAEIHAAPQWLWTALVRQMIADSWTVATTREKTSAFKECPSPPEWSDSEKIAEALVIGVMKVAARAFLDGEGDKGGG